jgi:hypothetical protein
MAGVGAFGGFSGVFFVEFVPAQHGEEAPARGPVLRGLWI